MGVITLECTTAIEMSQQQIWNCQGVKINKGKFNVGICGKEEWYDKKERRVARIKY